MTPMKYRCWRKVEGDWELAGYEAVISGRWHTSKTPDMADAKPGTFDDMERDQYTGRKDEDRREIYEGDIVTIAAPKMKGRRAFKVTWNARRLGYDAVEPNPLFSHSLYNAKVEVIGNTYESPELLESHQMSRCAVDFPIILITGN